ncbi:serine aminopeptidase domain-containing protein [Leucobacter soli]|uniref:serine aminopeptidase domain-containing protein n=1 Tax=Leucobacter soli TaxID=2812850 RepID=UPI003607966B
MLFGHSTGGLILSLWADRHRGTADAVVLNSPWLELQVSGAVRRALAPVVNLHARHSPHDLALPQLDLGFYKRSQGMVAEPDEQALVNLEWRPEHAQPVRAGWLRAILDGHARIERGIDVGAPACVLLSARSSFGMTWREDMLRADTVLEVEGVARASLRLGPTVTIERIDGALHDVFLSERRARASAYRRLDCWVTGWAAAYGAHGAGADEDLAPDQGAAEPAAERDGREVADPVRGPMP